MGLLKGGLIRRGFNLLIAFFIIFISTTAIYFYIAFMTNINAINISLNILKDLVSQGILFSIQENLAGLYFIFVVELVILMVSVISLLIALKHVSELYLIQKRNAHIDPLTQMYNRRAVMYGLKKEIEKSVRLGHPISIAVLDIDYFKKYNDTLGHVAGDKLLIRFAKLLMESIREYDLVGRIGGEEFLVVFPETKLADAVDVCERIRETIEKTKFAGESKLPHKNVTVSIGVVEYNSRKIIKKRRLINFADELLYQAKETGRNKVVSKKVK